MFMLIGLAFMFYGGMLIIEAPGTKNGGWCILAGVSLLLWGFWLIGVLGGMSSGAGGPAYG